MPGKVTSIALASSRAGAQRVGPFGDERFQLDAGRVDQLAGGGAVGRREAADRPARARNLAATAEEANPDGLEGCRVVRFSQSGPQALVQALQFGG